MSYPYIIAEIGSNFKNLNDCLDCIQIASDIGCDAVKFQMATWRELYGIDNPAGKRVEAQFNAQFVGPEWAETLYKRCKQLEIDFMCSAFSPDGYKFLDEYVSAHKIARCESNHPDILKVLNESNKHIYLSTGASTVSDIRKAIWELRDAKSVTLMACSVAYPCKDPLLNNINVLKQYFSEPGDIDVGLSDHMAGTFHLHQFMSNWGGITALEKHFNPLKVESNDACVSIGTEAMRILCESRQAPPDLYHSEEQNPAKTMYRRRLVAIEPITKGDVMFYNGNVGAYRALIPCDNPVSPFDWGDIDGAVADRNYLPGESI